MGKRAAGGTFEVVNPAALARCVRERLNAHDSRISDGLPEAHVVAAMADTTGVRRQTLDRILRGHFHRLRGDTIHRLSALWDEHQLPPEVFRSIYPVADAWKYMQWVTREIEKAKGYDAAEAVALLGSIRAKKLVPELEVTPKWAKGRFYRPRLELRVWRALAALLPSARGSEGVERHWTEMTDTEICTIVRAGLKQQNVLLKRDSDAVRLSRIAIKAATPVARLLRILGYDIAE
jgi:hypothetical protein